MNLPDLFISETWSLSSALAAEGRERNHPSSLVERLCNLVPRDLRGLAAKRDSLSGVWRYEFGEAYKYARRIPFMVGTAQWPEVRRLYEALHGMDRFLAPRQIEELSARLVCPLKHQQLLEEFAAVAWVPSGTVARYEPLGWGRGQKRIDWLLIRGTRRPVALEVKHREYDLVEQMEDALPLIRAGLGMKHVLPPSSGRLFTGTTEKFRFRDPDSVLQGAWIAPSLLHHAAIVHRYFDSLDSSRLHFALLVYGRSAFVLARSNSHKAEVLDLLGLTERAALFEGVA